MNNCVYSKGDKLWYVINTSMLQMEGHYTLIDCVTITEYKVAKINYTLTKDFFLKNFTEVDPVELLILQKKKK